MASRRQILPSYLYSFAAIFLAKIQYSLLSFTFLLILPLGKKLSLFIKVCVHQTCFSLHKTIFSIDDLSRYARLLRSLTDKIALSITV